MKSTSHEADFLQPSRQRLTAPRARNTPLQSPPYKRISQSESRLSLPAHPATVRSAGRNSWLAHLQLAVSGVKAPGYYACMVEKALKSMDLAELIKASSTREPPSPASPRRRRALSTCHHFENLNSCSVLLTPSGDDNSVLLNSGLWWWRRRRCGPCGGGGGGCAPTLSIRSFVLDLLS